jgi:hypothetical protein
MLPWPERAVYLLREVLRYSRRDTALLLGMSDSNIDQLHSWPRGISVISAMHPPNCRMFRVPFRR